MGTGSFMAWPLNNVTENNTRLSLSSPSTNIHKQTLKHFFFSNYQKKKNTHTHTRTETQRNPNENDKEQLERPTRCGNRKRHCR